MLEPTDWPAEDVDAFRVAVLENFSRERRAFPWREEPDPYRVLVSEFMLQQTRTETVVPYFRRWMRTFPSLRHLAEADPERVLREWEGLGYYRRARNLHRSAREIVARYGGEVPPDPVELRTLPGVGEYTAGAVASIAYGVPAPAVDGNVRRVMARLADAPDPKPSRLRAWMETLVDPGAPGDFNQGMMEIGSLVCSPRAPSCGRCPLVRWCRAKAAGTQEARPLQKQPRHVPHVRRVVAAIVQDAPSAGKSTLCLRRRPDEGLLARMWELPSGRVEEGDESAEASVSLAERHGVRDAVPLVLDPVPHAFTHRRVTYEPFLFRVPSGRVTPAIAVPRVRWVPLDDLEGLPIPVAQRKIIAQVARRAGLPDGGSSARQVPNSSPERPEPPSGD